MDGWNTSFLLGWPIFWCELLVSGRVSPMVMEGVSESLSEPPIEGSDLTRGTLLARCPCVFLATPPKFKIASEK